MNKPIIKITKIVGNSKLVLTAYVNSSSKFCSGASRTLMLFLLCVLSTFKICCQETVTLLYEDTPLRRILSDIEKQTSFDFIYNNESINPNKKWDVHVENLEIQDALNLLFANSDIGFEFYNSSIILKRLISNQSHTISGTVKDFETGELLIGANISIHGSNIGATSNEYGYYSLTIPEAIYTIQISHLGYADYTLEINLVRDTIMDFELSTFREELSEVVVLSNSRDKSQINNKVLGVNKLKSTDIKELPALLGEADINRSLMTLPGISSVGEATSGFNVRGGNIDQNLILLDEAPMYVSSHLFGLFSIGNADAVKDISLFKGTMPAKYGGRASSVVDIRMKEGNQKQFEGEGGIGIIFSRITLEGPIIRDKASFLISARRSYFDVFFPLLGPDLEGSSSHFFDLNTKISFNINQKNRLFASGYFGGDVYKFMDRDDATGRESFSGFKWNNATATLRWNHIFSNKLFMNLSTIYSSYKWELETKDEAAIFLPTNSSFKFITGVENWLSKIDFTRFTSPTVKWRYGLNSTLYKFKPAEISSTDELSLNSLAKENALEISPYGEIEKTLGKFIISLGLRYSWFGNFGPSIVSGYRDGVPLSPSTVVLEKSYRRRELIKSFSGFEPRLSIKYELNDREALRLGISRARQYVHLISNTDAALPFDVWKPSGEFINPLIVDQVTTGYSNKTENGLFDFTADLYYKNFTNFVEYKNGADLIAARNIETLLLPADGHGYGVELAAYKTKGKFTGNVNYSYSVARRRTKAEFDFENVNSGNFFPSNFDRPHSLNITANYVFSRKWSLGAFFTYQSGRPFTQPNGKVLVDGTPVLTYSKRNANRLDATHRLDLMFSFYPESNKNRGYKESWSFGVYNCYNRKNPFSNISTFQGTDFISTQFSVLGAAIPFISYNFKF